MKLFSPLALLLLACRLAAAEVPLPETVDYNHDVRPILSDNCFKCHGFDEKTRDGGRRLDTPEGALAESEGIRAIVPGQLAASDLHVRIHSAERDEAMPPLKSGKTLTARQKAILDRWIEQGAPYAKHWSFEPIRPEPPPGGAAHPVDAFIQARLPKEGLAPSPEADPYLLARRLHLDLIGRIPTPEEADRFVKEAKAGTPQAVEKLADRLLASPQYGERWARRWMDLARYADTNGYEKDRPLAIHGDARGEWILRRDQPTGKGQTIRASAGRQRRQDGRDTRSHLFGWLQVFTPMVQEGGSRILRWTLLQHERGVRRFQRLLQFGDLCSGGGKFRRHLEEVREEGLPLRCRALALRPQQPLLDGRRRGAGGELGPRITGD